MLCENSDSVCEVRDLALQAKTHYDQALLRILGNLGAAINSGKDHQLESAFAEAKSIARGDWSGDALDDLSPSPVLTTVAEVRVDRHGCDAQGVHWGKRQRVYCASQLTSDGCDHTRHYFRAKSKDAAVAHLQTAGLKVLGWAALNNRT